MTDTILTPSQQEWQNQYEALNAQLNTYQDQIDNLTTLENTVGLTTDQSNLLKVYQTFQVDTANQLYDLEGNIDAQLSNQVTIVSATISEMGSTDPHYDDMVAYQNNLLQGQTDLALLAQNWVIPSPGTISYTIDNYVWTNNGQLPQPVGEAYVWDSITRFVSGAVTGANNMIGESITAVSDISSVFNNLDPVLQYQLCQSNYNAVTKVMGSMMSSALQVPESLTSEIINNAIDNANDYGFSIASNVCKVWMPKDDFLNFVQSGAGTVSPDLLNALDSLAPRVEFTIDLDLTSQIVANSALDAAINQGVASNLSSSVILANASLAYENTMTDFQSNSIGAWNTALLNNASAQIALSQSVGGNIGQTPEANFGNLASAYMQDNTPASGTPTNDFTSTVTIPTTTSSGATDLANPPATYGTAAAGGNWSINTDPYALNDNTDLYSSILGDILTNGIRPGNWIDSGTSNSIFDILYSANMTDAIIADAFDAISNPYSYFSVLDNSVINLANSGSNITYIPADPLILDLNGDGVNLTSYADQTVLFDIDHDGGSKEQTGWVAANTTSVAGGINTDGIVVYDLNGNGIIDNISETMSEYFNGTVGTGGDAGTKPYANGFAALKSLDSNGDNQFTSADAAWNNVKIWVDDNADGISFKDTNGNGIMDAGEVSELHTLSELGITSINLAQTVQSGLVNGGNEVLASGSFVMNGITSEAQAANFLADPFGQTITSQGNGTRIDSQTASGTNKASYVSHVATGEAMDAATLGVVNLTGNAGDDTLTGDANANWLMGSLGSDTFYAGAGDDVLLIDGQDQQANIHGGAGNDIAMVVGDGGVVLNLALAEIEAAVGGTGNDVFIGGGNSSVFVRGGDGDDVIVGGGANDALSGENGNDLIDGGAGNDVIHGGRGQDQLLGGAGDDIIMGGQDDDQISGGAGNDVLRGEQGDDVLDGGDGTDFAEFSGSFADYRITKLDDTTYRVVDIRAGRDGADILKNIERLNFADLTAVDITLPNPMPVKDVITIANRTGLKLIKVTDLLANDRDWQGDVLHITTISDIVGGTLVGTYNSTTKEWTPTLTANGELQFTPDPNYTGVMSFKYKIADSAGHAGATAIIFGTTTAAEMRGQVFIKTPDMPTDSIFTDQWYLNDINILPVWEDYTGKGVRIAQYETDMPFSTGPEIFDYRNPDLQPNVDQSWIADPNADLSQTPSEHATLVAGVMVAARNGEGAVGVAYDAKLSGHYFQGTGLDIDALSTEVSNALAEFKNYDVVNNSWGTSGNFLFNVLPVGTLETGILDAVTNGRNGLGTAIVMAGGNDRQNGGNTNADPLTANRAVIVTGAINAQADISTLTIGQAPFSNPGTSILVSAPGSNVTSTSDILMSNDGSVFGNDTSTVQGTSFATPIISGVIALMLQANPNLGWRDIQQILALSARKVNDPNTDTVYNSATNWNGGGMHVSTDYGFGDVDAHAAVRLAETWQGNRTSYNERHLANGEGSMNGATNLGIALNNNVVTRTLAIGAGVRAEHVDVSLDLTHSNWGDLLVELISPTGIVSKLVANPGTSTANPGGDVGTGQFTFTLDTTHDYGENAQGNWQIRITDRSGLGTGTLNGWKVDVYGSDFNETINGRDTVTGDVPVISATADNQYYYTDEFGSTTAAPGTARNTLTDTNGGLDIVNAAAVTTNSIINLNNGTTSTIAGRNLTINGDVEFAFGGDGNDTITGNAVTNRLQGGRGNDTLSGGAGVDFLDGGPGNDTLTGGSEPDFFIIRNDAGSTDTITDFSPGTAAEKILLVGFDNVTDFTQIVVTQESANTRLNLGNGQSVLLQNIAPSQISEQNFGFFSDDNMLDYYAGYLSNSTITWGTAGVDNGLVPYSNYFALGGNDLLGGTTTNSMIDGGDGNDLIYGDYTGTVTPGADWLEGGAGDDTMYGGAGDDLLLGGSGNDYLEGDAGNDILRGATGADALYGGDGNDVLLGGAGYDYLDGGNGSDVLMLEGDVGTVDGTNFAFYGTRVGGAGADVFKVTANGGGNSGFSVSGSQFTAYNLIADFDPTTVGEIIDLTELKWVRGFSDLTIQNFSINGTLFARIIATDGINQLAINLRGVDGNTLTAAQFSFATTPGLVFGGNGNDVLTGDAGANTLDGGAGADSMTGRTGDDTYIVDNVGDTVNELPGGGFDTVNSSVTYTLSSDVENIVLTGSAAINATGNDLSNRITGNAAANVLDGMGGADTMLGGAGDDIYVVDSQADTVIENVAEGTDTVQASVSYTLGNNIENLQLTGTGSINATGNDLANTLTGNSGDNILDGAGGADAMAGGLGDDTYLVDNTGDTVTENLNEGIDTVYAAVNYTLAANIENLVLTPGAIIGTGNELDNLLTGNSAINTLSGGAGNDWLNGGTGADTMIGGTGNDTYIVDNVGDVVTETSTLATEIDTVQSSITYTLGANVENLTLTGTAAINGTGNTLDNVLYGNSAVNTLDGGTGADTMIGGTGNDTYIVDNVGDVVMENLNEGTDIIQSSVTYTLSANVENLTLTGTASINGTGNALVNIITGNAAANTLDGGTGADTMIGGTGNDTYIVDNVGDVVTETSTLATEIDTVQSSITYTLGANVENLTLTGTAAINGTGNTLNNTITGNAADNVLSGGTGADTMIGGTGNDTYIVDNVGDVVTETSTLATEIDNIQSSVTYTLSANVENLTLTGTAAINGTGNTLDNVLYGNSAVNTLDGGTGADTMIGGTGNDTYIVDNVGDVVMENLNEGTDIIQSSVTYTLSANVENLTLTSTAAINGTGNALVNIIAGNAAANTLDGGTGADTMVGGTGNDTYIVDNVGDVVTETSTLATEIDTVQSSITYTLGANVENLTLTGTAAINGTGNTLNNTITGNAADNVLSGGTGADTMIGGTGNDTYIVDNAGDVVTENAGEGTDSIQSSVTYTLSANVENLTLTGTAAINGTGNTLDNVLYGNSAVNTLDGGTGADTMVGGTGNDTYIVDNVGDVVTETSTLATEIDTVQSSITYTLGANVENLTLTSTAAINGTGNALVNIITGNAAANTLDGGTGADTMIGGTGNDTYIVDNVGDVVTETSTLATEIDTVQSSITYTLGANVENLTLTGTAAINGTGNTLNNTITGNAADNVLSGGTGADTMIGGTGNDTYIVDNVGDVVTETSTLATEIDNIQSSVTYTLSANVENLTLTGTAAINGTGNELDNILTGNTAVNILIGGAGNDTLNGGTGADTMIGGTGNDTYIVDNAGDVVTENAGEGTDSIQSSVTYTLSANVENLTLTGTAAINGTGNTLDNVLYGNSAVNTLDGGTGADTMVGGTGNDTYIVDNVGDVVTETSTLATEIDTVQSSITYTLGANVENLTLTSTAAINGTGNALVNIITGNAAANTLDGGTGADTMIGGTGNDTYIVDNVGDVVTETSTLATEIDTVQSSITYTLGANVENLTLTGTAAINGTGNTLNNTITGNAADNVLSGGTGADTMIGGTGNDTYIVDNVGDVVTETSTLATEIDNIQSSVTYTLSANVENLTLTGTAAINGTGNELDNILTGNTAVNILIGGAGNDTLNGGTGADTMIGGTGNDTYIVDNAGDVVTENAGEGTDSIQSSVTYTLSANVENLTLTGTAAINGTGNTLDNVLYGNSAVNTLDGGTGADTMVGGTGNDTYIVDNVGDVVTETSTLATEIDTVQSSITYTLGANVENLTLTSTAAINGTGNALVNIITGNAAANTLDGGTGADTMIGGTGNDTYIVDNVGDVVTETSTLATEIDTVQSSITYTLGANVENLTLTGTAAINGTGNTLNNTITGNAADNVLSGGTGADTMIGGTGNDTYIVDNVGDVVTETSTLATEIDNIQSSVTYTLSANVENLTLTGTAAINGTGNELDNILTGNTAVNILIGGAGNDTLNGGTGADTMIGGTGNDTYIVDNAGDVVTENAGEGTDSIQSSVTYTLSANVENLTLTGTTAINGTGNTLDNVLYGNTAANTLTGGAGNDLLNGGTGNDIITGDAGNDVLEGADGNDTLSDTAGNNLFNGGAGTDTMIGNSGNELYIGGSGNDTITTGTGADIIAFNTGDGQDTVVASTGADNTLSLGGGINYANLALSKSGNNLILATGGSDQITLQNWYSGTTNHSIANLQLVLDAGTYNSGSSDPLLNQQVQDFDFAALAQAFDQALAGNPTLTSWSMTDALLSAHLSGSDTAALGGDLAYQYNLNGTLAGIGLASAQTVINDASFGTAAQQLHPLVDLQTGAARLG